MRYLLCLPILLWWQPTGGHTPSYYDSIDTADSRELRSSLSGRIGGHRCFPYTSRSEIDTWDIVERADAIVVGGDAVRDVYKGVTYTTPDDRGQYHREHAWPKSYGFPKARRSNCAYSDAHNLFVAHGPYNSSRSNKPFGNCKKDCEARAVHNVSSALDRRRSNWTRGAPDRLWEVHLERRGDLARALLHGRSL